MDRFVRRLNPQYVDSETLSEIERFIDRKLDEHMKFRGQIGRDLRRMGAYAFLDEVAYRKLREKYIRAHAGRKKLAILEMERLANCR